VEGEGVNNGGGRKKSQKRGGKGGNSEFKARLEGMGAFRMVKVSDFGLEKGWKVSAAQKKHRVDQTGMPIMGRIRRTVVLKKHCMKRREKGNGGAE